MFYYLGEHRCNNVMEGHHKHLRDFYEYAHPNLWIFLKKLAAFQVGVDVLLREMVENGPPAKRKNDKYDAQTRLCMVYKKSNSVEFIVEIAKTMW